MPAVRVRKSAGSVRVSGTWQSVPMGKLSAWQRTMSVQVVRRGSRGWRPTGSLTVMARHISFAEADEHNPGAGNFPGRPERTQLSGTAQNSARNGPVSRPAQASGKYLATASRAGDQPVAGGVGRAGATRQQGSRVVRKAAADLPGTVTCLADSGQCRGRRIRVRPAGLLSPMRTVAAKQGHEMHGPHV